MRILIFLFALQCFGLDLRIISYNILERGAIYEELLSFDADILCLQDVDNSSYAFLEKNLPGYEGFFAKDINQDEVRLATFFKKSERIRAHGETIYCEKTSKCRLRPRAPALLTYFEISDQEFLIINTKVRWQTEYQPEDPASNQVQALLDVAKRTPRTILVGDFNMEENHFIIQRLRNELIDLFFERKADPCYSLGGWKRIDYIWHTRDLQLFPMQPYSEHSLGRFPIGAILHATCD